MKVLSLAALTLLFALPAHAQNHATMVTSVASPTMNGGGGGAGSAGGAGGGYGSSFNFSTGVSSGAPVHYQYTFAHGTDGGFVPSTFVPFAEAVKMGEAALVPPPPVSIAQVAAEYRALKQRAAN